MNQGAHFTTHGHYELYFPIATIVLAIGAAITYAYQGDWRRAIYWGAAAVITASVTF